MARMTISPAFAARMLAEQARRDARQELRLELRLDDRRFEAPPRELRDDAPDALVLEADGSFTELRD